MAFTYGTIKNCTTGDGTAGSVYQVRFGYELQSQNENLNQSTIKLQLQLRSTNSQYKPYGYSYTTTIEGTTNSGTYDLRSTNTWTTIGTRTVTVTHNSDGTYNVNKTGSFTASVTGARPKSGSANVSVSLPTIARASQVYVADANIGSSTTISVNSASSNSKFTYYYRLHDSDDWTLIVEKTSGSYSWTVPTSFYSQIPNSKTLVCQFNAETFINDVSVGTTTTQATFTAKGNPTINSATATDINSITTALTNNNTKMVKYASNVQIAISVSGQNNATISSVVINGNNVSLSGTNPKTGTITFNNSNTNTFQIVATDSRGYTTTQTLTMDMVNYIPLTINATIKRNQPTDNKVNINFNGNYFNGSFGSQSNTLTVQYCYKESTSSTWGSWNNLSKTISGNSYSGSTQLSNIDYTKIYNFQIVATDKIGTKSITNLTVSKGEPVYWWDDDEFNVNGSLKSNGNIYSNGKTSSTDGNAGVSLQSGAIEISGATPYIDFHYNNSTSDYTNRIVESSSGNLQVLKSFQVNEVFRTRRTLNISRDALGGGVSGRYYKLASLPASNDGNAIQLNIKGIIGNWATKKGTIELQISNRESLRVYGTLIGSENVYDNETIVIYQESNNSHTIYLRCVSDYCSANTFEFSWGCYAAGSIPTIYTDNSYTTSPTGTLKWTSNNFLVIPISSTLTGTGIVTRASGATVTSSAYRRYGNVVQLTFIISTTSSTSEGSNCFTGTINNSALIPKLSINSSSFNGSTAIIGYIDNSGNITLRILNGSLPSGKESTIGFTYVI